MTADIRLQYRGTENADQQQVMNAMIIQIREIVWAHNSQVRLWKYKPGGLGSHTQDITVFLHLIMSWDAQENAFTFHARARAYDSSEALCRLPIDGHGNFPIVLKKKTWIYFYAQNNIFTYVNLINKNQGLMSWLNTKQMQLFLFGTIELFWIVQREDDIRVLSSNYNTLWWVMPRDLRNPQMPFILPENKSSFHRSNHTNQPARQSYVTSDFLMRPRSISVFQRACPHVCSSSRASGWWLGWKFGQGSCSQHIE